MSHFRVFYNRHYLNMSHVADWTAGASSETDGRIEVGFIFGRSKLNKEID
jgi:hypothetical protein